MRRTALVTPTMVLLALAVTGARAQESGMTPELTTEQSWAQAVGNLNAMTVALIRHARDHGQTPAELGTWLATLFGPSWSDQPGTGTPRQLVQGMAANLQLWPDAEVEVSATGDGSYELRHNRPWIGWFGDGRVFDVTLEEFEAMWDAAMATLAEYLGLSGEIRRENGDWVMTVRDVT